MTQKTGYTVFDPIGVKQWSTHRRILTWGLRGGGRNRPRLVVVRVGDPDCGWDSLDSFLHDRSSLYQGRSSRPFICRGVIEGKAGAVAR